MSTNKAGTVADAIAALEKIKDKTLPLYFDCPHCGRAHIMKTVNFVVVIETERKPE